MKYFLPNYYCRKGRVTMPRNYVPVSLSVKWMHVYMYMRRTKEVTTTYNYSIGNKNVIWPP